MAENELLLREFPPDSSLVEMPPSITLEDGRRYMEVEARKSYFHRYCAAYRFEGSFPTEKLPEITATTPNGPVTLGGMKCTVYINGHVVATGHDYQPLTDSFGQIRPTAMSNAETKAIGRALGNAGFNLVGVKDPGDVDGEGLQNCAETPISGNVTLPFDGPTPATVPTSTTTPTAPDAPAGAAPGCPAPPAAPAPDPGAVIGGAPNTPQPDHATAEWVREASRPDPPASREEAMVMIVPNGNFAGKKLYDLNLTARWFLEYIIGKGRKPFKDADNFPRLVAAAKMVLDGN